MAKKNKEFVEFKDAYFAQDPVLGKTYGRLRQDKELPPTLDSYPTSMRIRSDPETNAVIPTEEAVEQAKRWADFNTK